MINTLRGTLMSSHAQALIIDMHGIGLEVSVPYPHKFQLQQEVTLHTFFHWNQESGPQLFGFETQAERSLFSWIITCQGIGPKLGLLILHQLTIAQCIEALQQGNVELLSSIKGLGPKKAEVLILHARNKHAFLSEMHGTLAPSSQASQSPIVFQDVYQALQTLHYSPAEITPLLRVLHQDASLSQASFDVVMRRALALLAKQAR